MKTITPEEILVQAKTWLDEDPDNRWVRHDELVRPFDPERDSEDGLIRSDLVRASTSEATCGCLLGITVKAAADLLEVDVPANLVSVVAYASKEPDDSRSILKVRELLGDENMVALYEANELIAEQCIIPEYPHLVAPSGRPTEPLWRFNDRIAGGPKDISCAFACAIESAQETDVELPDDGA